MGAIPGQRINPNWAFRAKLAGMAKSRPQKKLEPRAADSKILPMELRVGDRLGEWEVIGLPYTTTDGRIVHARAQRIDEPDSWEIRNWDVSKRLSVERMTAEEGKR